MTEVFKPSRICVCVLNTDLETASSQLILIWKKVSVVKISNTRFMNCISVVQKNVLTNQPNFLVLCSYERRQLPVTIKSKTYQ